VNYWAIFDCPSREGNVGNDKADARGSHCPTFHFGAFADQLDLANLAGAYATGHLAVTGASVAAFARGRSRFAGGD
jgi:hypothetical protein